MSRIEWTLISEDKSGNAKRMIDEFFKSTIHNELFTKICAILKELLAKSYPKNFRDIDMLLHMLMNLMLNQNYFPLSDPYQPQQSLIGLQKIMYASYYGWVFNLNPIAKFIDEKSKKGFLASCESARKNLFSKYDLPFDMIPNNAECTSYSYDPAIGCEGLHIIVNIHDSVSEIRFLDINQLQL